MVGRPSLSCGHLSDAATYAQRREFRFHCELHELLLSRYTGALQSFPVPPHLLEGQGQGRKRSLSDLET